MIVLADLTRGGFHSTRDHPTRAADMDIYTNFTRASWLSTIDSLQDNLEAARQVRLQESDALSSRLFLLLSPVYVDTPSIVWGGPNRAPVDHPSVPVKSVFDCNVLGFLKWATYQSY